jgi:diacylglycerol kinase (ATP)
VAGRHSLPKSFAFAWDGLAEGTLRDRNLRIHLALGVLASAFAARAPLLAPGERALLLVCVALVLAAESANSAIEAVVDLASPGWDERARVAKDAAAGAVLAVAAGSVVAFAAIAGPRLGAIFEAARALALPVAGAVVAAVAVGFLPAPGRRLRAVDVILTAAAVAGLAVVAHGAESQAGTASAVLCLAIAAGGAAKRRVRG